MSDTSRPAAKSPGAARRSATPDPAELPPHAPLSERILWASLLLIVVLVPLVWGEIGRLGNVNMPPFTYDQYDILKTAALWALLAVAAGAWLWSTLVDGRPLRYVSVMLVLVAFLGWVVVTTIFSIHPPTAILGKYRRFEGLAAFFGYGILFFLTVQVADRPQRIRRITQAVVLSGAVVAAYGVLQHLGLDPIPRATGLPFEPERAYSTMGNPDLLGGYLIFPLVLSVTLALGEKRRWPRLGYWLCFLVDAAALLTSFTRGAWIGGAVALALLAIAAWRCRVRLNPVDMGMAGLAVMTGVVIVARSLGSSSGVTNVASRLKSIFEVGSGSGQTRIEIWTSALRAIRHSPIVGYGADTFRLVFPRFKVAEYARDAGYLSVADNAHAYPLQIATGLGIPGLILLYGLFGWILARSARSVFHRRPEAGLSPLAGFWAATVGYLVYLLFGLSVTGSSFLLWMSLGLLVASQAREIGIVLRPPWRNIALTASSLALVAVLVGDGSLVMADHYYLRSKILPDGGTALKEAQRAVRLNPMIPDYRAQVSIVNGDIASGWFNEAAAAKSAGQDPSQALQTAQIFFNQATETGQEAVRFVPAEFDNYVYLSQLYSSAAGYLGPQYYEEGAAWAEKGLLVEPNGLPAMYFAGFAYANLGRTGQAVPLLERAASMDPAYLAPRLLLGDMYAKDGNVEQARKWYEEATRADPTDQRAREKLAALEPGAAK